MWNLIKNTLGGFIEDDSFTSAAAVAFYSALSLSPILLLLVYFAGFIGPESQASILEQLEHHVGPDAGRALVLIVSSSKHDQSARTLAGAVSLGIVLFSATGVFAQLQYALNNQWNVKADSRAPIGSWIRKRVLSFGMMIAIGFLLLTSLAASTVLSTVMTWLKDYLPGSETLWQASDTGTSLGIFTILFAVMFKLLPDVRIAWRDVWVGSLLTAVLFVLGKWGIALYLGTASVASSYGAAGSLVALLVWIYYSSLILFLGAEFTQNWAAMCGRPIVPNAHAVWKDTESKEVRVGEDATTSHD